MKIFPQVINETKEAKFVRQILNDHLHLLNIEFDQASSVVDTCTVQLYAAKKKLLEIQEKIRLTEDSILKTHEGM